MCNRAARPCRSGSTTGPGTSLAPTSFSSSRPSSSPTHLLRLSCLRLALLLGMLVRGPNRVKGKIQDMGVTDAIGTPHMGESPSPGELTSLPPRCSVSQLALAVSQSTGETPPMTRTLRKLVFVEPKSTHLHIYSRVCIPRLGSVLLATIMRTKGYDVRVYIEDIHPVDMDEVLSADLVAISAITSTAPQSYRLADQARQAGAIAVIGGTHTSFLPDEGLEHADFVVRGEGEFAFQELVDAIQAGDGFAKIQNLSYLMDGRVVNNPERPKIPNLDVNPIPDYHLITGWKPGGVISVATSRGCPFSCTFCSVPGMYGHAFRTHSVERVLQELEVHRGNLYTFFADDIFTANKKRCKELLRGMIQQDLTPEWGAQVRTETVDDPELLQMMRDANCFNVYVGFEVLLLLEELQRARVDRLEAHVHVAPDDARRQLLQRVRGLRVDQPSHAEALPEEAGPRQDRAVHRALPRPQDPHPRHVRGGLGRGRPRDDRRHRRVRSEERHRLRPVHDLDADP